MQLHEIRPIHKFKKRKIVGRGGKKGLYCGRGVKGQTSKSSFKLKPAIKELIKRYPKLRGYQFKSKVSEEKEILNLDLLEKHFKAEDKVNLETLLERKIISKIEGRMPKVKILGRGEISKPLIIEKCLISKSAKEKIEKAGGKVI